MATKSIRLTSPRGRLVQGDAFEANDKDANGAPLTVKTGANAGQPRKEWFIAVAFAKNHPETMPYLLQIMAQAAADWPAFFPGGANAGANFGCTHPRFSTKIIDGDGIDDNGKQNASKAGFAGHMVVRYSTGVQAPGVWQEPNFDEMARVTDPRMLPRGYFVRVNHTVQSNTNDQRPGMYINLDKIAICADQNGAEIIQSGPTAAEAFGASASAPAPQPAFTPPPAAAPGLVAVPGAAHSIDALRAAGWTDDQIVSGGFATRAAPAPLPVAPPAAPVVATPPAPGLPPAPATASPSDAPPYSGYMQPPPAAPTPPPAPARVMLPAAGGASYEALKAAGWTDEMMVQHGMMAA